MREEKINKSFNKCNNCGFEGPIELFARNSAKRLGYEPRCLECKTKYVKLWRSKHPEKVKLYNKNCEDRKGQSFWKYGITKEQLAEMISDRKGLCDICSRMDSNRRLVIDHDHETGKVRGLLCNCCNMALGKFDDNIDLILKAADYLKNHGKVSDGR